MDVTPKAGRGRPRTKSASSTLSASEALKAAEDAIGAAPPAPAPRKPAAARVKALDTNPSGARVKALDTNPSGAKPVGITPPAIVAATTAVDAAPEPEMVVEPMPDPIPAPIQSTSEHLPVIEGKLTMNDMIETGKKFAEDTKVKLETVYADLNEKAKSSVEKSTKAMEELSDLAKGNVEAMVESGKIAAKGMEAMGQEAVDYSRKSFEKATASFKTFATIKTPTEFFQVQSQLLSSSFDEFAKEAAKSSEAMMKLAGEVAQPLTARVTLVTDKVKSLAA